MTQQEREQNIIPEGVVTIVSGKLEPYLMDSAYSLQVTRAVLSAIPLMDMVAALEWYANPDIQNQHNYKALMGVDSTAKARAVLEKWVKLESGE